MQFPMNMNVVRLARTYGLEGNIVSLVFKGEYVCGWEGWTLSLTWPGRPLIEVVASKSSKSFDSVSGVDLGKAKIDSHAKIQRKADTLGLSCRVVARLCCLAAYYEALSARPMDQHLVPTWGNNN